MRSAEKKKVIHKLLLQKNSELQTGQFQNGKMVEAPPPPEKLSTMISSEFICKST